MPTTFLVFDFGSNEEAVQLARHKLEGWKQAFRLDKKLLFKFDRGDGTAPEAEPRLPSEKDKGKGKGKAKEGDSPTEAVKLLVRLHFSEHEKLSQQRWIERIPTEELFKAASPRVIRPGEADYTAISGRFDALDSDAATKGKTWEK